MAASASYSMRLWELLAIGVLLAGAGFGATFGKVVPIGGQGADLALDETRKVLYVANYTANRIDVVSLTSQAVQTSFNVAPQPSALALSPDGRYLVVCHYGNFTSPATPQNSLTILDLVSNTRQTFSMAQAPLGVAFGIDNRALLVTTTEFILLEPATGVTTSLATIAVVTKTLPTEVGNFPPNIVASSMAASGDGLKIYGIVAGGASDGQTIEFNYEVGSRKLQALAWIADPPMGPRVMSVNRDGSRYLAGWAMHSQDGTLLAQFPDPSGILNVGSHAIDTARGLIYAQMNTAADAATAAPVLQVLDIDNLAVLGRLQMAENLAGKSVLSSDGATMYSVSESGVTIFPIGTLAAQPQVNATIEDLVFQSSFCERQTASQQFTLTAPNGGSVPFTLSTTMNGVTVSPSSGVTPANITVRMDPSAFQNLKGTASGLITITSSASVNLPASVRVLVNNKEPDQRGATINIPGKLVDLLPDPARDRFFVLRQDRNQVLVFDGATYTQLATLKTGNTPTQMAITFDRRYLLVGHDNSQIISVFDLETLQALQPIRMPGGHYPRSVAASGRAILAATRGADGVHRIDRVDFAARSATALPTLGIFANSLDANTMLVASANGSSILAAQADGNLLLYNANVDTFTVGRKDTGVIAGAYAASSFDQFVIGNRLFNSSLVPNRTFDGSAATSSGFAFVDQYGFRTTAETSTSPGVIQRLNLSGTTDLKSTRMVEAPVVGSTGAVFSRTLAPLYSRTALVNLTVSGVTILPWSYDAATSVPRIDALLNIADNTNVVAPGSLVSVYGANLSPVNQVTSVLPLPTALGESCLTVNGVPVPMIFVSPSQINAQIPYQMEGNVTLILRTPGGVSDNYNFTLLPNAPSIFRSVVPGFDDGVPAIVRVRNQQLVTWSNPIHREEIVTIYLTGLGNTLPAIDAGTPGGTDPIPVPLVAPTVRIGNADARIDFAGLAPGQVGVYQINAFIPANASLGLEVPLVVTQGSYATQVKVRVIE